MPFPILEGGGTDGINASNLLVTRGYGSPEPASGFIITAITPAPSYVDITFNANVGTLAPTASVPEYWVFNTSGPTAVTVTAVAIISTNVIRLSINEPRAGDTYYITLPTSGLADDQGNPYAGAPIVSFVAVATTPYIAMIQSLDARTLRVIYSEPMIAEGAVTLGNYSILPSIRVLGASQETDSMYILTTDFQTPGVLYTLTATDVEDLAHNPV